MLLDKSAEITPERMKRWRQNKKKQTNKTHPIADVTSNGSKVQCFKNNTV